MTLNSPRKEVLLRFRLIRFTVYMAMVVLGLANTSAAEVDLSLIRESADKMQRAFMNGDFGTFVDYNYPALVERVGGREKMKESLESRREEVERQGIRILSVDVETPERVFSNDSGLYALVPMTLEMKVFGGKITQYSHLLAVSPEKDNEWTFLDAAGAQSSSFQALVPSLPSELVIPPNKPPLFESDDAHRGRVRTQVR